MENLINRPMIQRMMTTIQEKADSQWPAMYHTHTYKQVSAVLAKSDEDITYVDKETLRLNIHLLCDCLGIYYYGLLKEACQH